MVNLVKEVLLSLIPDIFLLKQTTSSNKKQFTRSKFPSPPIHSSQFRLLPRGNCYKQCFVVLCFVCNLKDRALPPPPRPRFIRKCIKAEHSVLKNILKIGESHIHLTLQLFNFYLRLPAPSVLSYPYSPAAYFVTSS